MAQAASSNGDGGPLAADLVSLLLSPLPSPPEEVLSTESTPRSPSASSTSSPSTSQSFFPSTMEHASGPTRRFSYDMLKEITDGFSEERLLGSGGYGKVYKGVHKDGKPIAVKVLYDMLALDDVRFAMEFNNLVCLQHDNIVSLVGYCHETRKECVEYNGRTVVADRIHRALCFEYVHNGSLHDNLSDEYNGHDWRTRYGIIKGICNGLKYLHQELKPPMYHLDLKPANVLLDENMSPKIADFGLSRLFGEEQTKITKTSIGTRGYLPPEYIEQNVISNKFDIFSLGVVIIKVMVGPEGHSRCAEMSSREFVKSVHENWKDRLRARSTYEPEPYYEQVKTCIEIALRCLENDRHKRPTISDIFVKMNETETKIRLSPPMEKKIPLASRFKGIPGLRQFKYSELAAATDRFSMHSALGEGAFSIVYKGSYTNENGKQEVAVKKMKHTTAESMDFLTELENFCGTRNMNLVELKGWCCRQKTWNLVDFIGRFRQQTDELFLVYELVPNGNLDKHLHHREEILPWEKRYQIVKGLGSALRYLHHEHGEPILHRDINPCNILLDYDFNVKLGGFLLSRIASQNNGEVVTRAIGTKRYMDPQCMKPGPVKFNRKTDVYGFGVVLLEIACTDKNREQVRFYSGRTKRPEVVEYVADPRLGGVFDRMEMERVIVLGLRCCHPDMKQRPYMVDAMKYREDGTELPCITEVEG